MLRMLLVCALLPLCQALSQDASAPTTDPLAQQQLAGVVRLADGRPWAGAEVHVIGSRFFWRDGLGDDFRAKVTTGPRGRFRIRVPADRQYSLYAVSPEKDWRSSGQFRISELYERGSAGRILRLRAQEALRRTIRLTIKGRERVQGALRCDLVGRSANFDRVSLPVGEDSSVLVPPRAGPLSILVFRDDHGPLGVERLRYRTASAVRGPSERSYNIPKPRRCHLTVIDRKTKKPVKGAVIREVLHTLDYADLKVVGHYAGKWLIGRRLGETGEDGCLAADLRIVIGRANGYGGGLRIEAPGYSMVSVAGRNKVKTPGFEIIEPEAGSREDAPVRVKVLLEPAEPRSIRLLGPKGAGLAGIRLVCRGSFQQAMGKNSYQSFLRRQVVLTSDSKGRVLIPAGSSRDSNRIDVLVDATLLRKLALPPGLLGQLPPTALLYHGVLWGKAADKVFDLASMRILRGRIMRQDGRPQRSPTIILEPAKNHDRSYRQLHRGWTGGRDGSFVRLVLPGSYILACMVPDVGYVFEDFEVEAGEGDIERKLMLQDLCYVSGTVVDAAGQPLLGADLRISGWSMSGMGLKDRFAASVNQRLPLATTDAQGKFRFSFIPSRRVRMRFSAQFRDKQRRASHRSQGRQQFGSESQEGLEIVIPVTLPKPKKDPGK